MKYAYPKIIIDLGDRYATSVLSFEKTKRLPDGQKKELAMIEVLDDTPLRFSWKK